eukprot:gnl/MRDRNA2_/MRDRNA2_145629_c0_seq1.p1 gnl/MRDRNA2_/MRDRNA2_145629_c0~~gnl/MRDRNA2_/MRDRNA2_145629_c0_seq1.p1  ORF type:complete len:597 (+),score=164.73 gnl/MRDRNA2_/MRDRNA2_145629_c0_seq1:79-1791(+)
MSSKKDKARKKSRSRTPKRKKSRDRSPRKSPPRSSDTKDPPKVDCGISRVVADASGKISEAVSGTYYPLKTNHGRPVFSGKAKKNIEVLIYFWEDEDEPDQTGWWFGPEVGGAEVWAFNRSNDSKPPEFGWRVPWDGDVDKTFTCIVYEAKVSKPTVAAITTTGAASSSDKSQKHNDKAKPEIRRVVVDASGEISEAVTGTYYPGEKVHGRPVFKGKSKKNNMEVLIYFWKDDDEPDQTGWWFGPEVGGAEVWAFNRSEEYKPPEYGWRVPWDGDVDKSFTIIAYESLPTAASSSDKARHAEKDKSKVESSDKSKDKSKSESDKPKDKSKSESDKPKDKSKSDKGKEPVESSKKAESKSKDEGEERKKRKHKSRSREKNDDDRRKEKSRSRRRRRDTKEDTREPSAEPPPLPPAPVPPEPKEAKEAKEPKEAKEAKAAKKSKVEKKSKSRSKPRAKEEKKSEKKAEAEVPNEKITGTSDSVSSKASRALREPTPNAERKEAYYYTQPVFNPNPQRKKKRKGTDENKAEENAGTENDGAKSNSAGQDVAKEAAVKVDESGPGWFGLKDGQD